MADRARAGLQRVLLLPTTGEAPGPAVRRRAVVLTAPDPAVRARAAQLGRPVVVCQELAAPPPGEAVPDRAHRLDALVRRHAVSDRWRDLVVVGDADTVRDVATGLCNLREVSIWSGEAGVVTVGLPRGPRPVRPLHALAGGVVVGLSALLTLGRLHPMLLPALVAATGVLLLPSTRTRHVGRTLLAAAGLAAALVFLVVAGAGRFPVE